MDPVNAYLGAVNVDVDTLQAGWSARLPRVPSTATGFEVFKQHQQWYDNGAAKKAKDTPQLSTITDRTSIDGVRLSDLRLERTSASTLDRTSVNSTVSESNTAEDLSIPCEYAATAGRSWWRCKETSYEESTLEVQRRNAETARQLATMCFW